MNGFAAVSVPVLSKKQGGNGRNMIQCCGDVDPPVKHTGTIPAREYR